jgi:hypothetical protein
MNKYTKYIFEFIVIFVGITASFLVDEWRTTINTRQKKTEYTREFLSDVAMFQKKLDSIKSSLLIERRFISHVLENTYTADSLAVYSTFPHYFKPKGSLNSATFQSIVSSGDLELIENKQIFVKLDIVDEHHKLLIDAINRSESAYVQKLLPIINKYGAMTEYRLIWLKEQKPNNHIFENLIRDKEYKEILSELHIWNSISFAILDYAMTTTKELETEIKNELRK